MASGYIIAKGFLILGIILGKELSMRTYKGHTIRKLFPSGMYETYCAGHFWRADTLQGIKDIIDRERI